ncbi:histidine phosphatase family protein [Streptomyces sp. SID2955]|nr:histidine phosphatase family protein [Streptomyces sp. SID2955]
MSVATTRRIVLVRHSKSEWTDTDDHERPLAERGRKDAPVAGRWLAESGVTPELALVSTAARARESWKLINPELSARPRTVYNDGLYEASLGELITLLNETPTDVRELLLLGHNPGMHALADALAGEAEGDLLARMNRTGFPSSAIAVLTFEGSWESVEHGTARLDAFWSPHA